jgi:precorrin-2 dehydrogenase/sirohydrochlorin ferrochelatase
MNTLFPIFANLKGKICTVVGGGTVALRKILGLLECQASVRVIASKAVQQIIQLNHKSKIDLVEKAYQKHDITGSFLVVAATDDADVNKQIYQECTALNILCNVVDNPDLCNFYYASTYTCGDLKIAISTNGVSPALARKIKAELSEIYPDEFIPYLRYLQKIRETVKEKISEESTRKAILKKIVRNSTVLEQCKDERFCRELDTLDYNKEVDKWL